MRYAVGGGADTEGFPHAVVVAHVGERAVSAEELARLSKEFLFGFQTGGEERFEWGQIGVLGRLGNQLAKNLWCAVDEIRLVLVPLVDFRERFAGDEFDVVAAD